MVSNASDANQARDSIFDVKGLHICENLSVVWLLNGDNVVAAYFHVYEKIR